MGSNQLAPGDYTPAIDSASVRLVEATGKAYEVAAKIETGGKKFQVTAITSQKVNGTVETREIRLGGTKIQVDFR